MLLCGWNPSSTDPARIVFNAVESLARSFHGWKLKSPFFHLIRLAGIRTIVVRSDL